MRCEEVKALLNDLIDGELDEEKRRQVEAHIRVCAECASEKRRLERVVALLRSLPRKDVPVDLLPSLRASRVGVGLRRLVGGLATAAAALLVAILIMPLLKEGVVTEKAAEPFVGAPAVAPEAAAPEPKPTVGARKEVEKADALQTAQTKGRQPRLSAGEKETALKQNSSREGWGRSGRGKSGAVAATQKPPSAPTYAQKAAKSAVGKPQRTLEKAAEIKAVDRLLKNAARKLAEEARFKEKMLRKTRRMRSGGRTKVVLFRAWIKADAVDGLIRQINAVAQADKLITKPEVKQGKNRIEMRLTADERGASIIKALISSTPKGSTLLVVRFRLR